MRIFFKLENPQSIIYAFVSSRYFCATSRASLTLSVLTPTPCAPSSLPPACFHFNLVRGLIYWDMHLSSKDFCHTSSPCTGVEAFRPQRLRCMVNMYDPATFGVDAEDIYGLAEFFRLKYNSLENLNIKGLTVHPALKGGSKLPLHCPQHRRLQSKLQLVGSCGKTLQRFQQPEHRNA